MTNKKIQANNGKLLLGDALSVDHATGRIGIGTDNPDSYNVLSGQIAVIANTEGETSLSIVSNSANNGNILFADGTTGDDRRAGRIAYSHSSNTMFFFTNGNNTRAVIDSSGNVGIGATDPTPFEGGVRLLVNSPTGAEVVVKRTDNELFAGNFIGCFAADSSDTNNTTPQLTGWKVTSTTTTGEHDWYLYTKFNAFETDTNPTITASTTGSVVIGPGGGGSQSSSFQHTIKADYVSPLKVQTTYSGASVSGIELNAGGTSQATWRAGGGFICNMFQGTSGTTSFSVTNAGAVTLGPSGGAAIQHSVYSSNASTSTGSGILALRSTGDLSGQIYLQMYYNSSTPGGGLQRNGVTNGIQFFTGSDRRIKENITDAPSMLNKLLQVQIREYSLKGTEGRSLGVVAQELVNVFPEKVNTTDDGTGDELPEGVQAWTVGEAWQYELIKAIQELNAKVEALEAQLGSGN